MTGSHNVSSMSFFQAAAVPSKKTYTDDKKQESPDCASAAEPEGAGLQRAISRTLDVSLLQAMAVSSKNIINVSGEVKKQMRKQKEEKKQEDIEEKPIVAMVSEEKAAEFVQASEEMPEDVLQSIESHASFSNQSTDNGGTASGATAANALGVMSYTLASSHVGRESANHTTTFVLASSNESRHDMWVRLRHVAAVLP